MRKIFRTLKNPAWKAQIPVAAPGAPSVKPFLPSARRLMQVIGVNLERTGTVPRTREVPTFAKQCLIVSDLLSIAGLKGISQKALQHHRADIVP